MYLSKLAKPTRDFQFLPGELKSTGTSNHSALQVGGRDDSLDEYIPDIPTSGDVNSQVASTRHLSGAETEDEVFPSEDARWQRVRSVEHESDVLEGCASAARRTRSGEVKKRASSEREDRPSCVLPFSLYVRD